jgi:hypothetical protein
VVRGQEHAAARGNVLAAGAAETEPEQDGRADGQVREQEHDLVHAAATDAVVMAVKRAGVRARGVVTARTRRGRVRSPGAGRRRGLFGDGRHDVRVGSGREEMRRLPGSAYAARYTLVNIRLPRQH